MSDFPQSTLAAILVQQGRPLEIAEIFLPKKLEVGQVIVEFHYSGICGSQIGEIDGIKGPDRWLPHLLGHEGSGSVLSIGPGVTNVKPGDTVVAHWRPSLGIEAPTPTYFWGNRAVNAGWVTTFNRYGIISENRLTPIPKTSDLRTAALYGCAITTGFGTIDNVAKVRLGETVVIFGAGGIGLNIIQAAALAGARTIAAVDRYDDRLKIALSCGATHIINVDRINVWDRLKSVFLNDKVDIFIDNTGNPDVIRRGYELIHSKGRVILVGVPKIGAETALHTLSLHFGKSIVGTTGGESMPHSDIPRYMRLAAAKKIDFSDLITEVRPLQDINYLIEGMRVGRSAGRCLIKF